MGDYFIYWYNSLDILVSMNFSNRMVHDMIAVYG